jgi:DNA replicative helicase MCM subunit Mcm2 (Cdc46/Mcm family)
VSELQVNLSYIVRLCSNFKKKKSEFQDSQGYTEKPCLEKQNKKQTNKKTSLDYRRSSTQKKQCLEKQTRAEMAQRLRAPTALPEVLSSNPCNHMVAHNHL